MYTVDPRTLYIRIEISLLDDFRLKRLTKLLGLDADFSTLGILGALWTRCMTYARTGSLAGMRPSDVAAMAGWNGDPDLLMNALAESEFFDPETQRIVEFMWHGGQVFADRAAEAERKAKERQQKKGEQEKPAKSKSAARNRRDVSAGLPPDIQETTGGPLREEKREENISSPTPLPPPGGRGLVTEIAQALSGSDLPGDAVGARLAAASRLRALGFEVAFHQSAGDRGDGRCGRVDVLGRRRDDLVAIAIDGQRLRLKSVQKLTQVQGAVRFILTRARYDGPPPEGIDAVISLSDQPSAERRGLRAAEPDPVREGWADRLVAAWERHPQLVGRVGDRRQILAWLRGNVVEDLVAKVERKIDAYAASKEVSDGYKTTLANFLTRERWKQAFEPGQAERPAQPAPDTRPLLDGEEHVRWLLLSAQCWAPERWRNGEDFRDFATTIGGGACAEV